MSVSSFTSATFAVVKKYTELACIFIGKISHRKIHSNLRVKSLPVKARVKIYMRVFCVEIRHIACNIYLDQKLFPSMKS